MASLLARIVASFDAIKPVPNLTGLDGEHNQLVGASGVLNGGSTASKLLVKTSDGTDPPIDCDQVGAGALARYKQNGVTKVTLGNTGLFTMVNTAVNPSFNADQVDGIEGANIAKLDTHKTAFSMSFELADPSTPTTGAFIPGGVTWICPDGASITVTKLSVTFQTGSHTSGGSVSFTIQLRTAASTWTSFSNLGTVTLDNTNNTVLNVYTNDIADAPLAVGDTLIMFISARSGTISERDVSVAVRGTQKFTT